MPMARSAPGATPEAATASAATRRVFCQISSASCSTQPGEG